MSADPDVRLPAVAGQFYPDSQEELTRLVRRCVEGAPAEARRVPAVMVPHAGLVYSGGCAGQVFGRIAWPEQVVILAPNHTGLGLPGRASLWDRGAFRTPLGDVAVATDLADELAAACPLVLRDRGAHRREHAIEVELPFLQLCGPTARLLPLVLTWGDWASCAELGRALAALAEAHPGQLLLVASSDMTHYEPAAEAARKDRVTLDRIERLDGEGLLGVCDRENVSMCGRAPAATVMVAARLLGANHGTLVDYRHSGLVTGDHREVVSYAGVIFDGRPDGKAVGR